MCIIDYESQRLKHDFGLGQVLLNMLFLLVLENTWENTDLWLVSTKSILQNWDMLIASNKLKFWWSSSSVFCLVINLGYVQTYVYKYIYKHISIHTHTLYISTLSGSIPYFNPPASAKFSAVSHGIKKNRGLGTFAPIEPSLPSRETPLGKRTEVQERLVWPSIWTYLISIRFFVILYRKNIGWIY